MLGSRRAEMMALMLGLAGRKSVRVASALSVATALIALAGAAMTAVVWKDLVLGDALPNLGGTVAGVVYALLGALIDLARSAIDRTT